MFSSKSPAYICHQLSMLMGSLAVFLKSTTLSLAATKSVTAIVKPIVDQICQQQIPGNAYSAPGSAAQGSKSCQTSAQPVSLEALERIVSFS